MQLNDTKIEEFGRNDGIESISHCQEKFFIKYLHNSLTPSSLIWPIQNLDPIQCESFLVESQMTWNLFSYFCGVGGARSLTSISPSAHAKKSDN